MKTLGLTLLAAIATLSFASPSFADDTAIEPQACASGNLQLELNVGGRSSKSDLIRALKILARYPQLKATPVLAQKGRATFQLDTSESCGEMTETESAQCAKLAGWTEIQYRLRQLRGVTITCEPAKSDAPTRSRSPGPKQDAPESSRQDGPPTPGSVTGSN